MSFDPGCPHPVPVVTVEPMIVIGTGHPFTFGRGHHLRLATCPRCHTAIGEGQVAVVGFADIDNPACSCGLIEARALIIHARCSTDDDEELTDLVHQYLTCEQQHA